MISLENDNSSSRVGKILISGANQQLNNLIRNQFLAWLEKNKWLDLVMVETNKTSFGEKIEFIPLEYQSNSELTVDYRAPISDLTILLSRWLSEVL